MLQSQDKYGKWRVEGKARFLVEPSELWYAENKVDPNEEKKRTLNEELRAIELKLVQDLRYMEDMANGREPHTRVKPLVDRRMTLVNELKSL